MRRRALLLKASWSWTDKGCALLITRLPELPGSSVLQPAGEGEGGGAQVRGFCGPGLSVITSVSIKLARVFHHVPTLNHIRVWEYNLAKFRRKKKWIFLHSW